MAELDAFERGLEASFRAFAERGVAPVDAVEFTERVAGRPRARRWPAAFGPASRFAWVLVASGLLLAALLAVTVVGGWWLDRRPAVVPPPPSPPPPATVVADPADILATTKAKPLPAQASCPPGSDPDAPGDVDQDRPTGGQMAFDRHAGRIVLLAPDPVDPEGRASQTWTYDVCTNTWQLMRPAGGSPPGSWWPFFEPGKGRLVYDADSDRTLAFVDDEIWSYHLAADRWTRMGSLPSVAQPTQNEVFGAIFYHDASGLVVVYDGADPWAYDVDTNVLSKVRQRPDPSLPGAAGLPRGLVAFGYDAGRDLVVAVVAPAVPSTGTAQSPYRKPTSGHTWTFDPGTGSWRRETSPAAADLIVCGHIYKASTDCFPTHGRAVFDEASGLPVFFNRTGWTGSDRIDAYDAGQGAWSTLRDSAEVGLGAPNNCQSVPPVYDPLNRRIVCLSVSDVSAEYWGGGIVGVWSFDTATARSHWLLEPYTRLRCDVSTLAGAPGEAGAADGTGAGARFSEPRAIVVDDSSHNAYVADTGNHAIRRLAPDGTVTTVAGALGEPGFADGVGTAARFDRPGGIAVGYPESGIRDEYGTLYVADTGNDAIRRIAPDGTVTTIARELGISPVGIAVDPTGTVYTGGLQGNVVLRIAPDGTVTIVAGAMGEAGRADGRGPEARFGTVADIKVDNSGGLTVVDVAGDRSAGALRTVGLDGTVTTTPIDWSPYGMPDAIDGTGNVTTALDGTVVRVDGTAVTPLAGRLGEQGYADGRNDDTLFRDPTGIAAYPGPGYVVLYIADSGNQVIRTMACTP